MIKIILDNENKVAAIRQLSILAEQENFFFLLHEI